MLFLVFFVCVSFAQDPCLDSDTVCYGGAYESSIQDAVNLIVPLSGIKKLYLLEDADLDTVGVEISSELEAGTKGDPIIIQPHPDVTRTITIQSRGYYAFEIDVSYWKICSSLNAQLRFFRPSSTNHHNHFIRLINADGKFTLSDVLIDSSSYKQQGLVILCSGNCENFDEVLIKNVIFQGAYNFRALAININQNYYNGDKVVVDGCSFNTAYKDAQKLLRVTSRRDNGGCNGCVFKNMDLTDIRNENGIFYITTGYSFIKMENLIYYYQGSPSDEDYFMRSSGRLNLTIVNCDVVTSAMFLDVSYQNMLAGTFKDNTIESTGMNIDNCDEKLIFNNNYININCGDVSLHYSCLDDGDIICEENLCGRGSCALVPCFPQQCACENYFHGKGCDQCSPGLEQTDCLECRGGYLYPEHECELCGPGYEEDSDCQECDIYHTGDNCEICIDVCPCEKVDEVCVDGRHHISFTSALEAITKDTKFLYIGVDLKVTSALYFDVSPGTEEDPLVIKPSPYMDPFVTEITIEFDYRLNNCVFFGNPNWKIQSSPSVRLVVISNCERTFIVQKSSYAKVHFHDFDFYVTNSYLKFSWWECSALCKNFYGGKITDVNFNAVGDYSEFKVAQVSINGGSNTYDTPNVEISGITMGSPGLGGRIFRVSPVADDNILYGCPYCFLHHTDISRWGDEFDDSSYSNSVMAIDNGGKYVLQDITYVGDHLYSDDVAIFDLGEITDDHPVIDTGEIILDTFFIQWSENEDNYLIYSNFDQPNFDIEIKGIEALNAGVYIEECKSMTWDKANEFVYSDGSCRIFINPETCFNVTDNCDEGFCKNGGECYCYPNNCDCPNFWEKADCSACPAFATGSDCTCHNSWMGEACEICPTNFDVTNDCDGCVGGWTGASCDTCVGNWDGSCLVCVDKWYGANCDQCPSGAEQTFCNTCRNEWTGIECDICPHYFNETNDCSGCINKYSGQDCRTCKPQFDATNDCVGCTGGWTGEECDNCDVHWEQTLCKTCAGFYQGLDCLTCPTGAEPVTCASCRNEWQGAFCDVCPYNFDPFADCTLGICVTNWNFTVATQKCDVCDGCGGVCPNTLHDFTTNCTTCDPSQDPKGRRTAYPECKCVDKWNGATCETCDAKYEQSACASCDNGLYEYDTTDCTVLITCFDKNPVGNYNADCSACDAGTFYLYPMCDVCENGIYRNGGCTDCLPGLSNSTDCLTCTNTDLEWPGCIVCLNDPNNLKDPGNSCNCPGEYQGETCDYCNPLFDQETCDVCINPLQDFVSACTDCPDNDFMRKNYPVCDECVGYYIFDTDCEFCPRLYNQEGCLDCINVLQDKDMECLTCLNDPSGNKLYPNCGVCDGFWNFDDDCVTCPDVYEQTECKTCADSSHDLGNGCLTCIGDTKKRMVYPECDACTELFAGENCMNCVDPLHDYNKACLRCLNDPYDRKNYPNCDACTNYWVWDDNCETCPSQLFNTENCDSCFLEGKDPETGCYDDLADDNDDEGELTNVLPGYAIAAIVLGSVLFGLAGVFVVVLLVVVVLVCYIVSQRGVYRKMGVEVELDEKKQSDKNHFSSDMSSDKEEYPEQKTGEEEKEEKRSSSSDED